MEEAEYRLRSRNALLVCGGVERLLSAGAEGAGGVALREACASAEALVSLAACQGMLWLAERGALDPQRTLSDMLALLPTAQNHSAIISTMGGLLVLELKSRPAPAQPYVCRLSLESPQHPFITVLERNSDVARDVLAQMQAICFHPDYSIAQNSLELLRAVFLWLLCHPSDEPGLRWRRPCWQLLLSVEHRQRHELELETLLWQQMSTPAQLQAAFTVYSGLADYALQQEDKMEEYLVGLIPALARLSSHFIRLGKDPRACYNAIDRCYSGRTQAPLQWTTVIVVPLLAENLLTSPSLYLHELFALCYKIITTCKCPSISINVLVAYSLQWLHSPSCLTAEALRVAEKILLLYREEQRVHKCIGIRALYTNKLFRTLLHTDRRLFIVYQQMKCWETAEQKNKVDCWLDEIDVVVDEDTKLECVPVLMGILLDKDLSVQNASKVLNWLLGMVRAQKDYMVLMLPLLVYKVANDPSPSVRVECLKAIPLMAHAKENVPSIVAILNKLKVSGGAPPSLLLRLYTSLVEIQGRCYPYLQEMLLDCAAPKSHTELKWETEIAKADAVKTTCLTRAGTYGAELVSAVSGLLNRCAEPAGAAASARALGALRALWRERIVSPSSTWYALAPKMSRDKRPAVQLSLCQLLGEVPHLRAPTPEYERFVTDAARRLWGFVAESHHPEVVEAACGALARYRLEDYTLKDVPAVYRQGLKLPAAYCKTPADAARSPEDVLDYIPSEIWPSVFLNTNQSALGGVQGLVSAYMEREVKGYRGGVYAAEARGGRVGEPDGLRYLPAHSVVRGLLDYLRKQGTSPSYECPDSVLLSMLECASREYARPLPPLEMCFLHDLFHRGAHFRRPCLLLAARQAPLSGSAKRLLDDYLTSTRPGLPDGDTEDDILMVFEILPALARSVAPDVLRGPVERYLDYAYTEMVAGEGAAAREALFVRLLGLLRECLASDRIHEANRTLLSQFVENYWSLLADDSPAWEAYAQVCCTLRSTVLERVTSPSSWWESSPELVRKVASVRARRAGAPGPGAGASLVWLNEIIDAAAACPSEHSLVLRELAAPLRRARLDEPTREWLLQLMARAQASIAHQGAELSALAFLCDVFMLSVVLVSGYEALEDGGAGGAVGSRDARCALFPSAVASLVGAGRPASWRDSAVQITEWLQHTRSASGIPDQHRSAFYHALVACRHSAPLTAGPAWRRVLGLRHHHHS